jgi:hypothetical protein
MGRGGSALRVLLAADILKRALNIEARYNHYHDDAGRFTTSDGVGSGAGGSRDGRVRVAQAGPVVIPNRATILARFPNATPGQSVRLAVSDVLARQEIAETEAVVPGYRPRPSFTEGVEGEISRNEADAQAAREARYRYQSESLTGGGRPAPRSTPRTTEEVCRVDGRFIGSRAPGGNSRVRTLNAEEFAKFLRNVTDGAVEIEGPLSYSGLWYRRTDGTIAGVRMSSRHGLTVDIVRSGSSRIPPKFKAHSK